MNHAATSPRILALNGSPRGSSGSTGRMLAALGRGMAAAGGRVETVDLARLDLAPCRACFACWTRTPGVCALQDDMAALLPRYRDADLVVFGTPLYHYHMTATMKLFLDRTLPLVEPWLVESPHVPGATTHPREDGRPVSALLLSPCGLPEPGHFESLVHFFRFYARRNGWNWLGEILRPTAEVLSRPESETAHAWYYQALERAGRELAAGGTVGPDTARDLGRDLFPGGPAAFRERANRYWAAMRRRGAARGRGPAPR